MKRIAILTQPLSINYGGILQAYALQKIIKGFGYEVMTIDRNYYVYPKYRAFISTLKNKILKTITKNTSPVFSSEDLNYISRYAKRFINQYIELSELIDTDSKMIRHFDINNYEAIIVGSDQTWRPKYSPNIYNFYLDFLHSEYTKKIAYASSFGNEVWEYDEFQTQKCNKLVQKFDAVSVREDSAVKLCEKYFNLNAELVLDPTLLLDKQQYIDLFYSQNLPDNSGKLYTYVLNQNQDKLQIISEVSKKLKITDFKNQPKESFESLQSKDIEDYVYPSVEGWIKGFYDAEFVVTDSFHGVVFSIIFKKPFIAIANEERGVSRFTSLLKQFDLEHRLIFNCDQLDNQLILEKIDFDKVNQRLEKLKETSLSFLQKNI